MYRYPDGQCASASDRNARQVSTSELRTAAEAPLLPGKEIYGNQLPDPPLSLWSMSTSTQLHVTRESTQTIAHGNMPASTFRRWGSKQSSGDATPNNSSKYHAGEDQAIIGESKRQVDFQQTSMKKYDKPSKESTRWLTGSMFSTARLETPERSSTCMWGTASCVLELMIERPGSPCTAIPLVML